MISVIVCSINDALFEDLRLNIAETIGTQYELIKINNKNGQFSISEAYNNGLKQANYDVIVFVHEDVIFHTPGWGGILINTFEANPYLGGIGIAGAFYKTKAPSAWWDVDEGQALSYLIQHVDGEKRNESVGWEPNTRIKEVAVIDGVFMVTKKNLNVLFDTSIPGFHCYDLNFSLEIIKKGFKIIVTKEILIEHLSAGSVNKGWVESSSVLHKKYKDILPISVLPNFKTSEKGEFLNLYRFIRLAKSHNLIKVSLYYWFQLIKNKPLSVGTHYHLLKIILR